MPDLTFEGGSRSHLPMRLLPDGSVREERAAPPPNWPALDGLRAVAVIGVILYHIGVLPGGYLGVDVFFVLSGFLITTLLLREWDARGGRVSFRHFYARRALRLLPALGYVIVGALVVAGALALITAAGRSYFRTTLAAVPWVLGFGGNWVRALEHAAPIGSLGALGQTWSLAVEEQFYLLWPILFVLLMRRRVGRRRLALVLTLLALIEMVYRGWLTHLGYGGDRIYYATDTHSDGLLIGCAAAFWEPDRTREPVSTAARGATVMWLAAAVLAALLVTGSRSGPPIQTSAAVVASAVITLGVVTGRTPAPIGRLLSSRHAVLIGRRSYGLYLYQYVVLAATEALSTRFVAISLAGPWYGRMVFAGVMVAGVGTTFVLAGISYRCVELPSLRLKRRFTTPVSMTGKPVA